MLLAKTLDDMTYQLPSIRAGDLQVRLAESEREVNYAKELRYRIFVEEKGAQASQDGHANRQDTDEFDKICDHLLVIDHSIPKGQNPVVGTYRLLRGSVGKKYGKFYTASEFDISPMLTLKDEVLELGRSCVAADYRSRSGMQLLWRGIGAYVSHYDIKWMFGCGSFSGVEIGPIKDQLSYLHHHHLAPPECRVKALAERYVNMNILPNQECDNIRIIAKLPPLIKGYLRLGGYVGDGAVCDFEYNTVDVCVIVKTEAITGKYLDRYTPGGAGSKQES